MRNRADDGPKVDSGKRFPPAYEGEAGCIEVPGPRNQIESLEKEVKYLQQIIQEQKEELLSLYRRLHS